MTDTGAGNRELRIEYLRLDQIRRDPGNSKDHDLGALAESLERFGFVAPMGMNERTGILLFGHGRLDELECLMPRANPPPDGIKIDPADGMWMAPVVRGICLSDEDGKAYLIADNRLVELGGWNEPELAQRLIEIAGNAPDQNLAGTGFDAQDVQTLVRSLGLGQPPVGPPEPEFDRAEELQAKWDVKSGQIWVLGNHRVACDDCADRTVLEALFSGQSIGCVLTDPPYGIDLDTDYSQGKAFVGRRYDPIIGDDRPFTAVALWLFFSECQEQFWWGADYYRRTIEAGDTEGCWIVWDKRVEEAKDALIGSAFELCYSRTRHQRRILRYQWTNWTSHRNQGFQREHPAEKPVSMFAEILTRWAPSACIVADPYLGAGTTMIACEMTGRICYGIEIEPKYVAVTIERWHQMTGRAPELIGRMGNQEMAT